MVQAEVSVRRIHKMMDRIADLTRQRDNLRDALVAVEGRLLSNYVQANPIHLGILGAGEIKWALDIAQMALLPYRSEAFKEAPAAEEGE